MQSDQIISKQMQKCKPTSLENQILKHLMNIMRKETPQVPFNKKYTESHTVAWVQRKASNGFWWWLSPTVLHKSPLSGENSMIFWVQSSISITKDFHLECMCFFPKQNCTHTHRHRHHVPTRLVTTTYHNHFPKQVPIHRYNWWSLMKSPWNIMNIFHWFHVKS